MSENKWLIGVVAVLLVALVALVCVGVGGLIYCAQPGSICANLLGSGRVAGNPSAQTNPGGATPGANNPQRTNPPASTNNGKVLRLPGGTGVGGDPITLDPATVSDVESSTYVVEIFSGLVSFNKDLKIVGELAQNWDTSPDGTTYTFHLKQDAKFADGRPVTR